MGKVATITRRTLLVGSAAIAGGVAFGYWKFKQPYENPLLESLKDGQSSLTPYVLIDQSGITVITPRAEMGQGVHTTLAAMVAEELDVALEDINIDHGPASRAYFNGAVLEEGAPFAPDDQSTLANTMRDFMHVPAKFVALQITGGSSTTPDGFYKMRYAGAAARQVLVEAASKKLSVAAKLLKTENGNVIAPDGKSVSYTEVASLAAKLVLPSKPKLKPQSEWKLLGKSLPRVDMLSKCTGTANFGIDIRLPGMLYATVRMNPNLGSARKSFDASKAESMTGVKRIIPIDGGVAVVATNTWYAFKAAQQIDVSWEEANYPKTTEEMFGKCEACFAEAHQDSQMRKDGDVDQVFDSVQDQIEVEYRAPFLAHATMEPMNATALVKDGVLDVWVGTQFPTRAAAEGVAITGFDASNVHIHTQYLGGGFGRRAEMDFVIQAITLAKEMEGTPIKLTWSREEDTTHDAYRPLAIARAKGAIEKGVPAAFDIKLSSPSVMESQLGRYGFSVGGPDATIVQAVWDQPYKIANYRATGYRVPELIPVSSWRSVGASQNAFFNESMMDELAHLAGRDPLEMRLDLIEHAPSRKVLEKVAEMSNWGSGLPEGHGRGIAFCTSFGVPTAEVLEVVKTEQGYKVLKAFAAVDVAIALDPRNIEAQVMSGLNFGLAAAIMGEITIEDGKIQQSNFNNYDSLRMHQAPSVEVAILENNSRIKGIGEPGTPPAAPALANAIFAISGQRLREMPFNKHVQFV